MKKEPLRKCVSCKARKPKNELIRVVKTAEDEVMLDPSGKLNGRGAYICLDRKCLEDMRDGNKLSRSLRTRVDSSIYDEIEKHIKHE